MEQLIAGFLFIALLMAFLALLEFFIPKKLEPHHNDSGNVSRSRYRSTVERQDKRSSA